MKKKEFKSLKHFCWYRRRYGGRWERHWIDMHPDRKWPEDPPCSQGTPEIEDHEQRASQSKELSCPTPGY